MIVLLFVMARCADSKPVTVVVAALLNTQWRRSLLKSGGGVVRRAKGRSLGRGYAPLQLGSGGLPPEKFG